MIHKEVIGHETYIYMNGELLIKIWNKDTVKVFCHIWGWKPID